MSSILQAVGDTPITPALPSAFPDNKDPGRGP